MSVEAEMFRGEGNVKKTPVPVRGGDRPKVFRRRKRLLERRSRDTIHLESCLSGYYTQWG